MAKQIKLAKKTKQKDIKITSFGSRETHVTGEDVHNAFDSANIQRTTEVGTAIDNRLDCCRLEPPETVWTGVYKLPPPTWVGTFTFDSKTPKHLRLFSVLLQGASWRWGILFRIEEEEEEEMKRGRKRKEKKNNFPSWCTHLYTLATYSPPGCVCVCVIILLTCPPSFLVRLDCSTARWMRRKRPKEKENGGAVWNGGTQKKDGRQEK